MNIRRKLGIEFLTAVLVLGLTAYAPANASAATGIVNPSFETVDLSGWTSVGNAFVNSYFLVGASDGSFQAVIDKRSGVSTLDELAPFMGVTPAELASVIGDGDLDDLEGSFGGAIQQHFDLDFSSSVTFDFNLFTLIDSSGTYPESIVAVLDGQAYLVQDTAAPVFIGNDGQTYFTGFSTFAGLPTLAAGGHDISVAAFGSIVAAGVGVDNFAITAVPEPSTIFLAALGLLGLGFAALRKKHRRV